MRRAQIYVEIWLLEPSYIPYCMRKKAFRQVAVLIGLAEPLVSIGFRASGSGGRRTFAVSAGLRIVGIQLALPVSDFSQKTPPLW